MIWLWQTTIINIIEREIMKKIYKSILGVSGAAVMLAGSLTPALVTAWGDSSNGRKSYTIAQINDGDLGNTITFNSISDGKIGDEIGRAHV